MLFFLVSVFICSYFIIEVFVDQLDYVGPHGIVTENTILKNN